MEENFLSLLVPLKTTFKKQPSCKRVFSNSNSKWFKMCVLCSTVFFDLPSFEPSQINKLSSHPIHLGSMLLSWDAALDSIWHRASEVRDGY